MEYGPEVKFKTIPIPTFLLEGYMTKSKILGWTTQPSDTGFGTIDDSLALNGGNKAVIVDDTGHDLSAGFSPAAEVVINSQAHATKHSNLTFTVPEIDHIPIAVSFFNPEWTVAMGVEKGTTVWNDDGTALTVSDSTVTENRAALVGLHANVNEFITEDGYKLIDAGVEWVLDRIQGQTDEFVIKTIESQKGRFMAEFKAKPTASLIDGVFGFSQAMPGPNEYSAIQVRLLFNNSGALTAYNSSTYESVNPVPYEGGITYAIKMLVDVPQGMYSAWVTPEGGEEVVLAEDYLFSAAVDSLNYMNIKMSFGAPWGGADGMVEISNLSISDAPIQKPTCAFFSKKGWQSRDSLLVEKLKEKYDVTLMNARDFVDDSTFTIDTLQNFDFTFMSESISNWPWQYGDAPKIRSVPVPLVRMDGYLSEDTYMGWTTTGEDTGYGAIHQDSSQLGVANNVIIVDETGHELAAGFTAPQEIQLVTDSDVNDILTFTDPEIDHIPIAVSSLEPWKTVIFGVEKGTIVWNKDGTVLAESDSTVTQNRAAHVGIFSEANNYMTDDAYKFIEAAIQWVLKDPALAIEDVVSTAPSEFNLRQNYPNPFNPSTEIAFTLSKPGRTTLTIYNVLGQRVATLLDKKMIKGTHQVTFDAHGLASGVYFYQIRSNEFSQIKKMVLMK
jgi:hypothetical protein